MLPFNLFWLSTLTIIAIWLSLLSWCSCGRYMLLNRWFWMIWRLIRRNTKAKNYQSWLILKSSMKKIVLNIQKPIIRKPWYQKWFWWAFLLWHCILLDESMIRHLLTVLHICLQKTSVKELDLEAAFAEREVSCSPACCIYILVLSLFKHCIEYYLYFLSCFFFLSCSLMVDVKMGLLCLFFDEYCHALSHLIYLFLILILCVFHPFSTY